MEPKGGDASLMAFLLNKQHGSGDGVTAGTLLVPAVLGVGDTNHDQHISKEEFRALGEKWFTDWDTTNSGRLVLSQVRTGLTAVLARAKTDLSGRINKPPRDKYWLEGPEGKPNGLASAMGIEFDYVHADLEFEQLRFTNIAVRYKGNGTFVESRGTLKRSLKLDLNEFVKGQKLARLGKLNLHNNVADPSWMNEVLSYRLFRDAAVPAPRTAYARVFVTVPGQHDRHYFGLYSLVENVDKDFVEDRFGSPGLILKPATASPFTDLGDDWGKYNQPYEPRTEPTPGQQKRVIEFCKLVSHAEDAEFAARLGDYLDLDNFARFLAVTVWLPTLDSILVTGQNYFVHLNPRTQKLQFVPWDLDHSFGQLLSPDQGRTLSIHKPWAGTNRFLDRVFKVEAFKKLYLAKLTEFSQTIFQPQRFDQQVNEIAAAIRPAIAEESSPKLNRFDRGVAGQPPQAGFFSGPPMVPIKPFVVTRAQSVNDQLVGKAEGQSPPILPFAGAGGESERGRVANPGMVSFLGSRFFSALNANQDRVLTREELLSGFAKWFEVWDVEKRGQLSTEQLRAGLDQTLPLTRDPPTGRSDTSPAARVP